MLRSERPSTSPEGVSRGRQLSLPGAVAGVVALLLILATATAITSGGWVGAGAPTQVAGAVGVLEALALGRARARRPAALLLALPLCGAVVLPATLGLLPAPAGHAGAASVAASYLVAAFTGLLASPVPAAHFSWAFQVGLAAPLWLCGYWLGWVGLEEHRGVLGVLPALGVLGVNTLSAPVMSQGPGPGSPTGLATLVAVLAALLVMGLAELGDLASRLRRLRMPAMAGLRSRYARSLVAVSVGVVGAGLLVPPLTGADATFGGGLGVSGAAASNWGVAPQPVGFSPLVTPGGPLIDRPQPVLTYWTSDGRSAYLGAVEESEFSQGNWSPDFPGATPTPRYGVTSDVLSAGAIPRDPAALGGNRSTVIAHISFAGRSGGSAGSRSAATAVVPGFFPGDPVSAASPSESLGLASSASIGSAAGCAGAAATCLPAVPYLDVIDVNEIGGSVSVPSVLSSQVNGGSVSDASVAQLEAAGTAYPAWVVSEDAAPLVGAAAPASQARQAALIHRLALSWTAGLSDPYAQAAAIETHLRDSFLYTLSPPRPPAGEWPIVYFLTAGHRGYCQYFASAMGAMLRSLGIPAMLVSGYGPGTPTRSRSASGQTIYSVSTQDAHVWVEAYFPAYGWVPFEPTPFSIYGDYSPFLRQGEAPPPAALPTSTPPAAVPATPSRPATRSHPSPSITMLAPERGLALAALPVLALLALLALRWWRRPRSLAGVWRRLALAGRLAGVVRGPAETRPAYAHRLARRLGGRDGVRLAPQLAAVAAVSGKAEFAASGLDAVDLALWTGAWTVIAAELTRGLPRRLLARAGRPAGGPTGRRVAG